MSSSETNKPEPVSELEMLFSEADLIPAPGAASALNAHAAADIASTVIQADIDLGFSESDLMPTSGKTSSGRRKVFLVDDDPDIVEILKVRLEGAGYDCVTASSGPEALGLLQTQAGGRPDLAVVDILMPGMDGYEVCRQMKLQSAERPFPIVLISEKTDTESVVRGLDIGAADFMKKPIDAQELLSRMRTVLDLREDLQRSREHIKELTHINSTLVRGNAKLAAVTALDELTGLMNRGHFLERLSHLVAVAGQAKIPLVMALFRFKTLSGGALTDKSLPDVARQLVESLRPTDLCARIEPIMFGVLMPATDLKEARPLSDKWKRLMGQTFGGPKTIDVVIDALKDGETPIDFLDRLEFGEWLE